MSYAVSDISAMVQRFSNQKFTKQLNVNSEILGTNALRKEMCEGVSVINVYAGTNTSTGYASDNGAWNTGASDTPKQGPALPKAVQGRIALGVIATSISKGGGDAADIVSVELKGAADHGSKFVARAIYDSQLPSLNSLMQFTSLTHNVGTATGSFVDGTGFLIGETIDMCSGSSTLLLQVQDVVDAAVGTSSVAVGANVVFKVSNESADLTSTNVSTSETFFIRGASSAGVLSTTVAMSSFNQAVGSGLLHGLGADTPGWRGLSQVNFGGYDQERLIVFGKRIFQKGGGRFTHLVLPPQLLAAQAVSSISPASQTVFGISTTPGIGAKRELGQSTDKYASLNNSGLTLMGKPVIEDPNVRADRAIFHNTQTTYLAQTRKFEPIGEGDDASRYMVLNRSNVTYDLYLLGLMEMVFTQRNSVGQVSGIGAQ